MSPLGSEEKIHEMPSMRFAASIIPLYSEPLVTIRIGSASQEYKLSKALITKQSPYFATMFKGGFQEGEQQSATLEEIDGVVSAQSFEMIAQWLYLGRVSFGEFTPEDAISAAVQLLRLADMLGITGLEHDMVDRIKSIILQNPPPDNYSRHPDTNLHCLTSEHILSAIKLPNGHPLRSLFAEAMVEGYLHPTRGFQGFEVQVRERN